MKYAKWNVYKTLAAAIENCIQHDVGKKNQYFLKKYFHEQIQTNN